MKKHMWLILALILTVNVHALDEPLPSLKIDAKATFVMQDVLLGEIVQSSDKKDIGTKLVFTGLLGDNPKVMFKSSSLIYEFSKRFENDRTLTLVLAGKSVTGGVDSFILDKKTGKFSRVSAGLIDMAGGVYATSALGVCE